MRPCMSSGIVDLRKTSDGELCVATLSLFRRLIPAFLCAAVDRTGPCGGAAAVPRAPLQVDQLLSLRCQGHLAAVPGPGGQTAGAAHTVCCCSGFGKHTARCCPGMCQGLPSLSRAGRACHMVWQTAPGSLTVMAVMHGQAALPGKLFKPIHQTPLPVLACRT